jgi:hypothetical protein
MHKAQTMIEKTQCIVQGIRAARHSPVMTPLLCWICMLRLTPASARDIDDIRLAVERAYSTPHAPWDEIGGPYARVEVTLLTPDFGVATAQITLVSSLAFETRTVRLVVRRSGGEWEIFRRE